MSLNGNWIYFIGKDFYLYKMHFDGNDLKKISDGCIEDFTADNRIVVYSDQNGLHKMASDGTKKATLVNRKVDRFSVSYTHLPDNRNTRAYSQAGQKPHGHFKLPHSFGNSGGLQTHHHYKSRNNHRRRHARESFGAPVGQLCGAPFGYRPRKRGA